MLRRFELDDFAIASPRGPGRKTLAEADAKKHLVYVDISRAIDRFKGRKKAFKHLKEDPEFAQLREQVDEIGETLDAKLVDTARTLILRSSRGQNSRPRTN